VTLHISNRKILDGFLQGLRLEPADRVMVIRAIDALHKVGGDQTEAVIGSSLLDLADRHTIARKAVLLACIVTSGTDLAERVNALEVEHPVLEAGLAELSQVMVHLRSLGSANIVADLSIARGFDYYTGTVYEGRFDDAPGFGSVVAGGRYDDLAGAFINKKLPGVGISIGFSRLFAKLLQDGKLKSERRSPADILVVLPAEDRRALALTTAQALRKRGFRVETYHAPQKVGRQLSYAEKKGIPFVWFPPFEDGRPHEVKDMASGAQNPADLDSWSA